MDNPLESLAMANIFYLFENNWLKGPFTEAELLKKFHGVPNFNVPPIWEHEGIDWQSITNLKLNKSIEETQFLMNDDNLFGSLPPGDLMLQAFQQFDDNPALKEKIQILFRDFRASGDPDLLEVVKSHLKPKGLKKTNQFGAYKILEVLGTGGMGKTYKAMQVNMERLVTLKVLKSEMAKDENFIREFQNEAKAIASLNHPNIVHAYESGAFGGRHYLCMEFVDGESLRTKIYREKKIPILESIQIILKVLQALQHAHEHKLVHRDVTPGNILLSHKGEVKLADYGLARKIETVVIDAQATATVRGSPYFISPEQIKNIPGIDIRADIYGLGCTFFYMLTGEFPFKGKSVVEVAQSHLKQPVPNIQEKVPEVSDNLRKVIEKMVAKDRDQRYEKPHDVIIDLMEVKDRYTIGGPPLIEVQSDSLAALNKKIADWDKGGELKVVIDKENREFTHLILKGLESRLEKTEAVDEFFGYACTIYTELVENAFDHGCVIGGKVSIQIEITSAFFRIIVEDTGKGFDYRKELDAIKHEKSDRERRRGLLQILNITKNITYNESGNRVKAVVYRKSANSKIVTNDSDNIQMIEISGKGDSLLTQEFENYVSGYDSKNPKRVCLMIRTPWVASLFVTQIAALKGKLAQSGSPFCVFVENHSCYKIMNTLGVTELVKTYESMNDALAYLNFSSFEEKKINKELASKEAPKDSHKENPKEPTKAVPGYHGKPKAIADKTHKETEKVEPPKNKGIMGFFKKD